jgi:hypothetical protein
MMPPHDDLTGGATMRSLDDPPGGSAARPQERLSGGPMARHDLDPVSLVFGFAFTGLGLLFLIGRADQALRVRWVWPVLLLVLGLGILFDVARSRTDRTPTPEPTLIPEPDAEPTHAPEPDPGSDADPDLAPEPDRDPDLAPDPEVAVDSREQPS